MRLTGGKILFIGDSITDTDRVKSDSKSLGNGYVHLVASYLLTQYPSLQLSFRNRGIGGDTLKDLVERWEKDCLNLDPDVVTILIGVNDTWENMAAGKSLSEEELKKFEEQYRYLLKSLYHRTDAKMILMEPYVIPVKKDRENWRTDLDPRIQIVRKLARDYQADFIPLDGILNAKALKNGMSAYTEEDGVHPSIRGHGEIAKAWLKNVDFI